MAHRYSAAIASAAGPTAGAVYWEFRNGSGRRAAITELGVFLGAATASGVGLVRATAQGTGGATTVVGQAEDPADVASNGTVAVNAFTLAPTLAGTPLYLRRARLPATIGTGIIWSWPESDPLIVPASASVVLVNIHSATGSAATDIYCVWEE